MPWRAEVDVETGRGNAALYDVALYDRVTVGGEGATHRPTVLDDPQINPQVNGRPELRLPVPKDGKWQNQAFEDAPARVWHNGVRQPVDQLEDVETEVIDGRERNVLVLRGGPELRTRIQKEWRIEEVHEAVRQVVDELSYSRNVDAPTGQTDENVRLLSASAQPDHTDKISTSLGSVAAEVTTADKVAAQKSCFTVEGEDETRSTNTAEREESAYSGDGTSNGNGLAATLIASNSVLEYDFAPNHTIPGDDFAVFARTESVGTGAREMQIKVELADGTSEVIDSLAGGEAINLSWNDHADGDDTFNGGGWTSGDVPADQTHTVKFEATGSNGDTFAVDVVAPADGQYSYTLDNSVTTAGDGTNYLDGPEFFPDAVTVRYDEQVVTTSISGGKLETSIDDTTNKQALRLSNDQGRSFASSSNTETFEHDFAGLGPSLIAEVTLGRYGSQTSTPGTGINGQQLDTLDLFGDVDDTPLIVDRSFDAAAEEVLTELADLGNGLWEYARDDNSQTVEWTFVGQRTDSSTPRIGSYSVKKTTADVVEKAVIRGGARATTESPSANHGSFVDLDESALVDGGETVRKSSDGTLYQRGRDYEMDYTDGRIKTFSGGTIVDGETLDVAYTFRVTGEFTASGVATPETRVFDVPELSSDRQCRMVAQQIVAEAKDPAYEARVVLPTSETGWSVIDDLDPPEVPTGGEALHIRSVVNTPGKTILKLGNRREIGDIVGALQTRLQRTARRA